MQAKMLMAGAPFAAVATAPAAAGTGSAANTSPVKKVVNAVKGLRDKVCAGCTCSCCPLEATHGAFCVMQASMSWGMSPSHD